MKYLVIKNIVKGCTGSMIFPKGVIIDMNHDNPKIMKWLKKKYIKAVSDARTEIHDNKTTGQGDVK